MVLLALAKMGADMAILRLVVSSREVQRMKQELLVLRHSDYDFLAGWSRVAAGLG